MDWFLISIAILMSFICVRLAYDAGESKQIAKQKRESVIPNPHKDFVTILDVSASGQDATLYQTGKMLWNVYTLDTNRVRNIRMHYKADDDVPVIDITPCEARQLSRALALLGEEKGEV